jgi:hypothetical protein
LPVDSVVVLLRPQANLRAINGRYRRRLPGAARPYLSFRYRVVRVWKLPVKTVLRAGLSVLPLAPISAVGENALPGVIDRMAHRLDAEADPTTASELWTATKVLLGLRYEAAFVEHLLQRVRAMKESTTYQAIKEEGRVEADRRLVLRVGEHRFGTRPTAEQRAVIEAITDAARLEELVVRAGDVHTWADLLEQVNAPRLPRRAPRKRSP